MKQKTEYPLYTVNADKKVIICKIKTRGRFFVGVSKCHEDDVFNLEKGKEIAYNRCRKKINKFVLLQDRLVEQTIVDIIRSCDDYGCSKERSKAWDDYLVDIRQRIETRKEYITNVIDKKLEDLLKNSY